MSNNIEDQIVSMKFDNKQFETGVSTSMTTIDKLKGSLAFPDAGKGLADVNRAAQGFNLNPMAQSIQGVSKMWLTLTTVAITAISNITNKVLDAGLTLAKSFTIDPIKQGFSEYEKNLNSIQTIVANTGKSVPVVNKYLQQLNHYSDSTIYNFGTMADAIGKFTAAGVKVDVATSAIKGMANSAALGGSSVDQLNTAMYQVSQALATGTIRLMDWNSISTAGLGGTNMQNVFKETAHTVKGVGDEMDAAIEKSGSFRESLQAGWFSADIFNKSMKVMAGTTNKAGKTVAFSVKQLQGMGYSLKAAKDLNKLSMASINAATKVKTFTQLIDVVKESIGSGWSKIFQDLFGDFDQATKLWTGVSNTITGAVGKIFTSVDKVLLGWRSLGGYQDLWNSIGNIFKVLGNLVHPVIVLFQALTPNAKKAGGGLAAVTSFLAKFTGWLVKLTDPIGNFTVKMDFMGDLFHKVGGFVGSFITALKPLLPILQQIGDAVGGMFSQGMAIAGDLIAGWTAGLDPAELQKAAVDLANGWITWIKDALGIHSPAKTMVPIGENIIHGIVEGLQKATTFLIGALQKIFVGLGVALKWMVQNISWGDILDTINTALFLGLVLIFKNFVKSFTGTLDSFKATLGKAGSTLDQLKSNLKSMQNEVRADIIRKIAISVVMLAGAAFLLSTIDSKKLGLALGAIGGLMAGLVGAMKVVQGKGAKNLDVKTMAKQSASLIALGTAMIAFSTAVLILSGAVAIMGQLDPKTMKQGLAGVAGVIALIVAATAILGKTGGGATILATATALIVLSVGLTAFVGVMKLYEKLDWSLIASGGGKAAAVILAVGLAMRGFGKGAIGGSIGMIIASAALLIMVKAIQQLAAIGLGDMIKSVVALDFILAALTAAATGMAAAEGGAMSMLVMAGAIIVLAKALQIVSKIPLLDLAKAIGAITLAILIIAGTSAALSELSPLIAALGTALLLIGGALFLAGAGIFLFASAMAIIAVVGPAAFQSVADGIDVLAEKLPILGEALGGFLVSILTGIVKASAPLAKALGKLFGIIIDETRKLLPKMGDLIQKLIRVLLRIIVNNQVNAAKAMIRFIVGMLNAMRDGVPKMITAGTNLIIAVIRGLSKNAVKIANATGKAVLDFLHGIHKAILKYEKPIIEEGKAIAIDLAKGLAEGLLGGDVLAMVQHAAQALADKLPGWMKKVLGIDSPSKVMRDEVGQWAAKGVAEGIDKHTKSVEKSAGNMAKKGMDAMKMTFKNSKSAADGLIDLQPKITPILDLTQLERDATAISGKMGSHSVKIDGSRRQARDIAAEHAARHGSGDGPEGGNTYEFIQNNYSPKPINHVKAYRGTRSQIALFKEVTSK